ncbi:hypothetical protein V6N11_049878 [Hibiscus sabdariffa]|uniref:Uncharacterized protein n=1 Tax=Hibiscus sabdariffa TaxID=183260 RepID=A0ABR2T8I8_9ROSI
MPLATWLHSTTAIHRNGENTTTAKTHIGSKRLNGGSHNGVGVTSTTTTSTPTKEERKKHEKLTNRPRMEASDEIARDGLNGRVRKSGRSSEMGVVLNGWRFHKITGVVA